MDKSKLSVIIPCFNEEENVGRIAAELLPILESLGRDFEVIVIDDGSTDNSVKEILKIKDPRIKLFKHPKNLGLGCAIRTAITKAKGDLLIPLDADFTYSPKFIPLLLETIQKTPGIDFVIGSGLAGGYGKDIELWRVVISKLGNKIYSFLLGRSGTCVNGIFRLYKTEQVKALFLTSRGFQIHAEILFKLVFSGKKFVEIPTKLSRRIYGVSHLNYPKEIMRHLLLVLKVIKWKMFGF